MTEKRNSTTSPKKQKSHIQKKSLQQVSRKKTPDSRFLQGLKRFLILKRQKVQKHKSKAGGIGPVSSTINSRLSASSNDIRKRKYNAAKSKLAVSMKVQCDLKPSSEGNRKSKTPAISPPVLSIQASSIRKNEFPAASPPALSIQDGSNYEKSVSEQSEATSEILNVEKPALRDQSSQTWEQDEHDLPEVAPSRPASHTNGKKHILRESNAVSPATVMPPPSRNAGVRVGFDRNLEPLKIVKMGELRGKYYFMMKWKGSGIMDMVPTEIAKERCPQVVIKFYEKHLKNVHNAMDCNESRTQ